MSERRIWTADELLALTPNQRADVINSRLSTDLSEAPTDLLERTRADIRAHIEEAGESHAEP